jgi:phosphohistidine phosphatase SixA
MKLILLRHGLQNKDPFVEDFLQPLSEEGRKQQQLTNLLLQKLSYLPKSIYTSPLERAFETGEMLKELCQAKLQKEEALGIHFQEERLLKILQASKDDIVCFVGHIPTLQGFAKRLVPEYQFPDLSRSSAYVLEIKSLRPLQATFLAFVTPQGVKSSF